MKNIIKRFFVLILGILLFFYIPFIGLPCLIIYILSWVFTGKFNEHVIFRYMFPFDPLNDLITRLSK